SFEIQSSGGASECPPPLGHSGRMGVCTRLDCGVFFSRGFFGDRRRGRGNESHNKYYLSMDSARDSVRSVQLEPNRRWDRNLGRWLVCDENTVRCSNVPSFIRPRPFNFIRRLSLSHEVSVLCVATNESDYRFASQLQPYCLSLEIVGLPRW